MSPEERPITADNETKQSLNELNSKAENKEVTKDKLDIDEIVLEKDEVGLKPLLEEKPRPKMMIFKPR